MAQPRNGVEELLDEWEHSKNRYNYYILFLFPERNEDLAKLYDEMLIQWERISGDCITFAAFATCPANSLQLFDKGNYFKVNLKQKANYDDVVRKIGRHFSVPESWYPSIIIFSGLKDTQNLTVQLTDLSSVEIENYIANIFQLLIHSNIPRYRKLWRIHLLLDYLPVVKSVDAHWIRVMMDDMRRENPMKLSRRKKARYHLNGDKLSRNKRVILHDTLIPIEKTFQIVLQETQRLADEAILYRHRNKSYKRREALVNGVLNTLYSREDYKHREAFVNDASATLHNNFSEEYKLSSEAKAVLPKEIQTKCLQFLQDLCQHIAISSAILYGSYAQNRAHEWSDVDLAIISDDFADVSPLRRTTLLRQVTIDAKTFQVQAIGLTPYQLENAERPTIIQKVRLGISLLEERNFLNGQ